MKTILSFLLFCLFFLSPSQSFESALKLDKQSTVNILTQRDPAASFQPEGTAWFYRDEYTAVTCAHVIIGYQKEDKMTPWNAIEIKLLDGTIVPVESFKLDEKADVGILFLKHDSKCNNYKKLTFSNKEGELGEPVCGLGFDIDYQYHAFIGHITGERCDAFTSNLRMGLFDAAINPGHSGSAILNESGRIIGMVDAIDNRMFDLGSPIRGIDFFVPLKELSDCVEKLLK